MEFCRQQISAWTRQIDQFSLSKEHLSHVLTHVGPVKKAGTCWVLLSLVMCSWHCNPLFCHSDQLLPWMKRSCKQRTQKSFIACHIPQSSARTNKLLNVLSTPHKTLEASLGLDEEGLASVAPWSWLGWLYIAVLKQKTLDFLRHLYFSDCFSSLIL